MNPPSVHAQLDSLADMFDWESFDGEHGGDCNRRSASSLHRCLPILASSSYRLKVDKVFERTECYQSSLASLESCQTFVVGLRCPLPVLEDREQIQGNLKIGLAGLQFGRDHAEESQDLEIESSESSPEEGAAAVIEHLRQC